MGEAGRDVVVRQVEIFIRRARSFRAQAAVRSGTALIILAAESNKTGDDIRGKFNIFFSLSSLVNSPVIPEVVRLSGTGIGIIKSKAGTSKSKDECNTNLNLAGSLATNSLQVS